MARHGQDREDLMREATALVRRVELQWPDAAEQGSPTTCIVGFRRTGEASIFVGAELVFQFNAAGELRRGFWNGRLVKAEGGRLVQLERRELEAEVQLVRHPLSELQTSEFLRLATETLEVLRRLLRTGGLAVLRRVPVDMSVASELAALLDLLANPLVIASAPNVGM
ncbi:MAG: hypothetical protein ABI614_13410 [Planctomycetota bacterium]